VVKEADRSTFALTRPYSRIELDWCGLLDVRYAPIVTKFCIAAKCRDVPRGDKLAARVDLNQATNAPDALSDRTHWMEVLDEARKPLLSALAGLAGYLGRWRRILVVQVKARDDL
jgi:hypothetical protein